MKHVAAPKKALTAQARSELNAARVRVDDAEAALWDLCAQALNEGTYDEVASVVGVARSTLQEKMRGRRT